MQTILFTQPETHKQLLERSFTLYRIVFFRVFLLGLLVAVASFLPRFLTLLVGQNIFSELPPLSPYRLWLIVSDILTLTLFSAVLMRTHRSLKEESILPTLAEDVKTALIKLPLILIALIILWSVFSLLNLSFYSFYAFFHHEELLKISSPSIQLLVSIVFTIQLILVVYLSLLFYFYLPIILIENKGPLEALLKSARLVWKNWWRTLSLQAIPFVIYLLILIMIKFVIRLPIHIYFFEPVPRSLLGTLINLFIFALIVPWIATLLLVQLRDLELRKNISPTK